MPVARGNIRTTLVVDGEQEYFRKLQKLRQEQAKLRSASKAITTTYDENTTSTKKLTDKQEILEKQIKTQKSIVEEYAAELEKLEQAETKDTEKIEKAEKGYNNAAAALNKLENELKDVQHELKISESEWTKAGKKVGDFGEKAKKASKHLNTASQKLAPFSAAAAGGLVYASKVAMDYESAFTGVKKTVDATEEEFDTLYNSMLNLSTELPKSASEIAGVGEIAGQLGIQTENIMSFSEAMIKLGDSTEDLPTEEAASQLAKFANITQMSQEDFEKLGSSIVYLGNNYSTTEGQIVSMAMRLAGAGKQVGMNEGQIMGLATAMSSVGIKAEMGGSAMSKAMIKMQNAVEMGTAKLPAILDKTGMSLRDLQLMSSNSSGDFKKLADSLGMTSKELNTVVNSGADLEKFSKVAGMSADEFATAWKTDAAGALTAFITGLKDTDRNGASAINVLTDMGITEVRLRDTLLRTSEASDIMQQAITDGAKAFEENTALTEEAEKRYETLESRLNTVKNTLEKVGIQLGNELMPYIKEGSEKIKDLADKFSKLDDTQKRNVLRIAALVAVSAPLLKTTAGITSGIGNAAKAFSSFAEKMAKAKAGEQVFAFQKLSTALKGTKEASEGAAAGAGALGAVSSGPLVIGLAAAAAVIAGLVIGYHALIASSSETKETFQKVADSANAFEEKLDSAQGSLDGIKKGLDFSTKDTDLQNQFSDIQSQIRSIAQKASDERRSLTEDEKEELKSLFDMLHEVTDEEMKLFDREQNVVNAKIEARNRLDADSAAEFGKQTQNILEERLARIKANEDAELSTLIEKHEKAGTINSKAYANERATILARYAEEEMLAKKAAEDSNNMIAEKLIGSEQGYSDMLSAFQKYNAEMEQAEADYVRDSKANAEGSLGTSIAFFNRRKKINEKFNKDYLKNNTDMLGSYLKFVESMLSAGNKLSDDEQQLVDEILAAYENLPKDAKKPWTDTVNNITSALKNNTIYDDASDMAKDFTDGFLKGLSKYKQRLMKGLDEETADIKRRSRKGLEIKSPSKAAERDAVYFNEGYVVGFEKSKPKVLRSAQKNADDIVNATKKAFVNPQVLTLSTRYSAALASAGAMQQAMYTRNTNYYSNITNNQSVAAGNNYDHSMRRIVSLLESIAEGSELPKSERQYANGIVHSLKSIGIKL